MLCSDGLWGPLAESDIIHHISQKPVAESAPDLVEQAMAKGGPHCDNITVIAVEWETPDSFESTRGTITTDSILEGVFASTVQAAWADSDVDDLNDLDDEAIERSIAEINEAIRRSAARKL
jgi:hypothetical protein